MYEALFQPKIWWPALVIIVGVIVFVVGNNRVIAAVRTTGIAIAGLAVLWYGVAWFVQTPIEQCITRTRDICSAVEAADWTKLGSLIDKRTTIEETIEGPEAIIAATKSAAEAYALKDIKLLFVEGKRVPPMDGINVTFTAILDGQRPTRGDFTFEYEKRSDGYLLRRIVPNSIGGVSMDQIRARIRR